ncbi:dehydrogenase/reductase SDR family member 11-like [Limulus polyphemus]|uniref:Dehydrogenase/reductase SDR family member 11-like n=1 Tax=Limulus polyphemus TaxID=6850 RepID=A0ABM1B0P6_LIMPO|nr:dehydrogenase/reductase SDR family member 11-like [Limulus polyphemus]
MAMQRWVGRVAVVTGASAGIGAEICRELVKHGMIVVGCARDVDRIRAICEEENVKSAVGSLKPVKCDLTKENEILSMFEDIRKTYGCVHLCINNAGFSEINTTLLEGDTDSWRRMLEVNVMGLCICTRESIKLMRENSINDGQIIHISSMSAHRVRPGGLSFYSGTKFMVKALAEGFRNELRASNSGIRVACISPGMVDTEFHKRLFKDNPEEARRRVSQFTFLKAEDIARAVLNILEMEPHIDINDIIIRPTEQPF